MKKRIGMLFLAVMMMVTLAACTETNRKDGAVTGESVHPFEERDDMKETLEDAGDSVRRGAEDVGDAVRRGAEGAGDMVRRGAEDAGDAVRRGADDVGDALRGESGKKNP